jgi:hypothetical protein
MTGPYSLNEGFGGRRAGCDARRPPPRPHRPHRLPRRRGGEVSRLVAEPIEEAVAATPGPV